MKKVSTAACVLAAALVVFASPASAQYYQYVAKFVCGVQNPVNPPGMPVLVPGQYYSAINVHNPTEGRAISFCKKFAIALPMEKAGQLTGYVVPNPSLAANNALEIDCADIRGYLQKPPAFFKGFAVIVSRTPLNVVVVYTGGTLPATTPNGQLATMDVETVPERRISVAPGCVLPGGGTDTSPTAPPQTPPVN
jgi:hypothetical protein